MTQGFFFSEINLLLCAYRNNLFFLKKTCMFIIVKNSFLVKKALGEMFDRNFHWGGGVISLSSYLILQSVVDHFFVSVK